MSRGRMGLLSWYVHYEVRGQGLLFGIKLTDGTYLLNVLLHWVAGPDALDYQGVSSFLEPWNNGFKNKINPYKQFEH